jgi:hypothetical protein
MSLPWLGLAGPRNLNSLTKLVSDLSRLGNRTPDLRITSVSRCVATGVGTPPTLQFQRFKLLTPDIVYFVDGHSERRSIDGYLPTSEEFEYCRQFIIAVALRMAELEAHTVEPSWMSTI